jgi:hypothetical protein
MLVDERPSISRARLARASDAKCSRERSAADAFEAISGFNRIRGIESTR